MFKHRTGSGRTMRIASWPARRNADNNPFQRLMNDALEERGDINVVEFEPLRTWRHRGAIWHWHWPENQLSGHGRLQSSARALLLLLNVFVARVRRIPLVLTIHNIDPHRPGQGRFGDITLRVTRRSAAGLHFLSESSKREFIDRNAWATGRAIVTTHHGRYFPEPADISQSEARSDFGLDPSVPTVAFVGQMDDYKRVDRLAQAILELNGAAQLLIVGRISPGCEYETSLRTLASESANIQLREGWATERTIARALQAADLVALPYRKITNSGSAILALSAGRAVIAPQLGALPEIAALVGGSWMNLYTGEITAAAISEALSTARVERPGPDLSGLSWQTIADEMANLYRRLRSS